MSCDQKKKHVAVLPFPFTSHPAALAKMSLRLAAAAPSVHFSFLNVPNSNTLIFPSNSKHHLPTNFKIYDIAAPFGPNFKTDVETYFNSALTSYESVIEAAVAEIGVPVSCILADVMTDCASSISLKMRVKWIAVWVAAPYSLLSVVQARAIVDYVCLHGGFDAINYEITKKKNIDSISGLSMFKVEDLGDLVLYLRGGNGNMPAMKRILAMESNLPNAAAVVLNCFEDETLAETVAALRSKLQTLVLHIGCPDTLLCGEQRSENSDPSGCLSWLDQQSPKSVVYICFGTTSLLSRDEISAIAEALEERRAPYLWSLKDGIDHLAGFIERTSSYGKVVVWAPQTLVLCHSSIGGHLMHAGFNSMVESIFGEVPMICRPIWAENPMNAQMVENVWRIGVGVEGRVITKNGLVKCLEMVLGDGEEGKMMRDRIKVLKEIMIEANTSNGSATQDFNSLVDLISS